MTTTTITLRNIPLRVTYTYRAPILPTFSDPGCDEEFELIQVEHEGEIVPMAVIEVADWVVEIERAVGEKVMERSEINI